MSNQIPRLEMPDMSPELSRRLAPRVERLGYLGEFFKCAASQPGVLLSFMQLTDELKAALPDNLTEIVALTAATEAGNPYERHQHERLCLKLGFSREWISGVISLHPAAGLLKADEAAVQRLALAAIRTLGRGCRAELDEAVGSIGPEKTVAVLMLIGRYLTHAIFVNSLGLTPPVPSIFTEKTG
ncbi:MAG: hypothetical protein KIT79_10485 [Deltaproteobacteria bacterium]|nr:hypothetical protein [Deltaproteobacteria bacterium]